MVKFYNSAGPNLSDIHYEVNPLSRFDLDEVMTLEFQLFFRQNADSRIGKFDYAEAGPQLLLLVFLQRIVNSVGYIDREYGLGRKRTDLLISKPLTDCYGIPRSGHCDGAETEVRQPGDDYQRRPAPDKIVHVGGRHCGRRPSHHLRPLGREVLGGAHLAQVVGIRRNPIMGWGM